MPPRPPKGTSDKERLSFTRSEVDPAVYPNTTQGKLFFRVRGVDYVCSGTVVDTESRRVIFTAGHCLLSDNRRRRWSKRVVFVPGYLNGAEPLGEFGFDQLWIAKGWAKSRVNNNDIGAVILSPNAAGQAVVDAAGARGFSAFASRNQSFEIFGYPAAPPFDGERLWRCDSAYGGDVLFRYPGPPQMSADCDMTGGSSGGGWIIGGSQLDSVTSFGDDAATYLTGPYFGSQATELYNRVRSR